MPSFESTVAQRYLQAPRKGAFVKIMRIFAISGIGVGVFAMVVMLAVMTGFREEIESNLFSATAHFQIAHLVGDIPNTKAVIEKLRGIPGVKGVSPTRIEKGLMRCASSDSPAEPLLVKAVDPASAHSTSSIFDSVQPISIEQLKEGEIILGKELATRLNVRLGDSVSVAFFRLDLGLGGNQPKLSAFRVAGFFQSHIADFDKGWAFIHLEDGMRLARSSGEAEYIEVRAESIDAIDRVKPAALSALGPTFLSTDLRETNKQLFAALRVEKWIFTGLVSFIVMLACINIVSSLVLLVAEKRQDLGVLLALGATPKQIESIFVRQGLWIAVIGTLWGLLISVPFCLLADHFRWIKLPSSVYDFITYLPFRVHLSDVILVMFFPLPVAWLAAYFPARRAANLDPVESLRAE
jgi:lipoprotein-releasing system permease protein